jgi:hypothetical protein
MDSMEFGVLEACEEVVRHQAEMIPLLAHAVALPTTELLYWQLRRVKQSGRLEEPDWTYFFHGNECNLTNHKDGRFLRIDFGPRGAIDTFTAWGVLQSIMTSSAPWREFPTLRESFAENPPPYDQYSGSLAKIGAVWDRLENLGVFEAADPSLVAYLEKYSSVGPDGITYVRFPKDTSDELSFDCGVAHRRRLSAHGRELLGRLAAGLLPSPFLDAESWKTVCGEVFRGKSCSPD